MATEDYPSDPAILKKIEQAKQYKDTADQAFKKGELKAALQSYHFSLMYLEGLDKNAMNSMGMVSTPPPPPPPSDGDETTKSADATKEKTEVDEIIEKIYSNQSACHLKLGNWDRAIQAADKALKKNENNHKALFRKAKALGEQGFFEKSVKIFDDLKKKNPEDAANIDAEVARLKALDQKREKEHNKKMKGFLSKGLASALKEPEAELSGKGKGKEKEVEGAGEKVEAKIEEVQD